MDDGVIGGCESIVAFWVAVEVGQQVIAGVTVFFEDTVAVLGPLMYHRLSLH